MPAPAAPPGGAAAPAPVAPPAGAARPAAPVGDTAQSSGAAPTAAPGTPAPAAQGEGATQSAGTPASAVAATEAPQAPIDRDEKRPLPDYDGRDDPTTAGDVLIWVPRIALSPLYLVSEFVVRRPLGAFVTWAEREQIPALLVDIFTFGPERNAGIVPTGLIDFGFRPSIGLYYFHNDWIPDNRLRLRAATWGPSWLKFDARNRIVLSPRDSISIGGGYTRRPDWIFHGIGPESPDERFRYSSTSIEASLNYDRAFWARSGFSSFVGIRTMSFDENEACCTDDPLGDAIRDGDIPEPPGLADGYALGRVGMVLDLDSRPPREAPEEEGTDWVMPAGHGVRLNLRGEHAAGLDRRVAFSTSDPERYQFVRYGATLTGYLDLTGQQRVLSLSAVVDFADPLRDGGSIPFTELVSLGGERPMRGFLQGRLLDRSAAVARLAYTWPVWVWLDGVIHYELGNVFGQHLENFETDLLRQSFGIGMRGTSSSDHVFEILLAFGTDTFRGGAELQRTRFVFGATSGF